MLNLLQSAPELHRFRDGSHSVVTTQPEMTSEEAEAADSMDEEDLPFTGERPSSLPNVRIIL